MQFSHLSHDIGKWQYQTEPFVRDNDMPSFLAVTIELVTKIHPFVDSSRIMDREEASHRYLSVNGLYKNLSAQFYTYMACKTDNEAAKCWKHPETTV